MDSLYLLYFLLTLLTMIILIYLIRVNKNKKDIFNPIYASSAFFFLIFVVRSIHLLYYGSEFISKTYFTSETLVAWNTSLIYVVLSFVMFMMGYHSKLGPLIARKIPRINPDWSYIKVKLILPMLLVIYFASFLLLIQKFGGFYYYVANKKETLTTAGTEYLNFGVSFLQIAFIVGLIMVFKYSRMKIVTFGFLFPLVLANSILSGSKGTFLTPFISMILLYHYFKKPIKKKYIVITACLIILIFPVFNVYRYSSTLTDVIETLSDIDKIADFKFIEQHFISRFHGMDSMVYIVRDTPRVMDFQLGKTIAPIFVAWIPRQLWPDKPIISFGKIFGETYYANFFAGTGTAPSATIIGEAYLNFHVAGVILISVLAGIWLRVFYDYLINQNKGASSLLIYSQLFLSMVMFWESDIAGFISKELMGSVICFSVSWVLTRNATKEMR